VRHQDSRSTSPPAAALGDPRSAVGFGSVWNVSSSADTVTRADIGTGALQARIHLTLPKPLVPGDRAFLPYSVAAGEGAVWVSTARGYLARIAPATNRVTRFIHIPKESSGEVVAKAGALWVSEDLRGVLRIDPNANERSRISIPIGRHERLSVGSLAAKVETLLARGGIARQGGVGGGYVLTGQDATAVIDVHTAQVVRVERQPRLPSQP